MAASQVTPEAARTARVATARVATAAMADTAADCSIRVHGERQALAATINIGNFTVQRDRLPQRWPIRTTLPVARATS